MTVSLFLEEFGFFFWSFRKGGSTRESQNLFRKWVHELDIDKGVGDVCGFKKFFFLNHARSFSFVKALVFNLDI